jgi:hypothetical protein
MGQKLIITEEEKNRIKLLYEVATPPSESVLVANKNPFKNDEYINARRLYDSKLKDGDLFYNYNRDINDEYIKNYLINYYKPLFMNKTVRSDDDNTFTIKDVSVWAHSYFDLEHPNYNTGNLFKLYLIFNDEKGSCINVNPVSGEITNCPPTPDIPGLEKSGMLIKNPFKNQITANDKVFKFIKSNLPKFQKSEYPDEGFEIRKISRSNTDF